MTLEEIFERCKKAGIELGVTMPIRMFGKKRFPRKLQKELDENIIAIVRHLVNRAEFYKKNGDEEMFDILLGYGCHRNSLVHSSWGERNRKKRKERKEKYQEAMYGNLPNSSIK